MFQGRAEKQSIAKITIGFLNSRFNHREKQGNGCESVYAVDTSTWIKNDAKTSPKRAYYHHHSQHSAGKPMVAGWPYHWIAQVSFRHDSWSVPLSAQRLEPTDNLQQVAAKQIRTRSVLSRPQKERLTPFFFPHNHLFWCFIEIPLSRYWLNQEIRGRIDSIPFSKSSDGDDRLASTSVGRCSGIVLHLNIPLIVTMNNIGCQFQQDKIVHS